MDTNDHKDDLIDLEQRLRGWLPSAGDVERDRMLFESGRAQGRGVATLQIGMASSACVAILLFVIGGLVVRQSRETRPLVAATTRTQPQKTRAIEPSPTPEIDPDSYLALNRRGVASILDDRTATTSPWTGGFLPRSTEPPLTPGSRSISSGEVQDF